MNSFVLDKNKAFADSVADKLNTLNNELFKVESEINDLRFKLIDIQLDLEIIEDKIRVEVAFDSTLNNERQREAATASEKRKSDKWVTSKDRDIPQLKRQIAVLETQKSYIYRNYQTLLTYLRYLNSDSY